VVQNYIPVTTQGAIHQFWYNFVHKLMYIHIQSGENKFTSMGMCPWHNSLPVYSVKCTPKVM